MYHCIARSSRGNSGCGTAVAPRPRWMGWVYSFSGASGIVRLRHAVGLELVAVRVAEIGGVEAAAAHARQAFARTAAGERDGVEPVDLPLVLRHERDHRAVADAGRIAVEGMHRADSRTATGCAPRDIAFAFHHP